MMKRRSRVIPAMLCLSLAAAAAPAADRVRIVDEGGIGNQWMVADGIKLAAPGYPADFVGRGDNVCVAMGYAIKPDGGTADFALLKVWNSSTGEEEPSAGFRDAFAQASAIALSQWKFKPRPEITGPQYTYTAATMSFMGKHATTGPELRGHCAISDLKTLVQEQYADFFQNSGKKQQMENVRRTLHQHRAAQASQSVPVKWRPKEN